MNSVALLERALSGRAIVFGSLPPSGRDIDLLVREEQLSGLQSALSEAGFRSRRGTWADFSSCPPTVIELIASSSWGLGGGGTEALFADAVPLEDCAWLCRPSPHHVLLILARRLLRRGCLSARLRERAEAAVGADPEAVRKARGRMSAWGCERSLPLLLSALGDGSRPTSVQRARALVGELSTRGRSPLRAVAGTGKVLIGWRGVGAVIALSGLDGSGKSTQTGRLEESLTALGYETVRRWPAIDAPSGVIRMITRIGKGSLRAAAALRGKWSGGSDVATSDPARALRRRSELVTFAWTTLYAVRCAGRAARMTWPHLLAGKVVICDRYELDTRVFLRHGYGESRGYRFQLGLVRLASPAARIAFLLEVPAEVATARQPERGVDENVDRAALYRRAAGELGVERVDGTRSEQEICAQLALQSWSALR